MKRKSKVIVAFVMTLLLIATSPIAAFAETQSQASGTIPGNSEVEDVILNIVLPTSFNFALDPLGLNATGDNQISAQDYFFVNQTIAPVKVSLDITATTSNGAVLIANPSGLDKDNTSANDKKLYFGALGANELTGTAITTTDTAITYGGIFGGENPPEAVYTTETAVADTLSAFTPGAGGATGSALIAFALQKADKSTTSTSEGAIDGLAAGDLGVAAFRFYSELNTYADWKANDVTVSVAYTLTPLRTATYDQVDFIDGSLNQIEGTTTPTGPTYSSPGFIVDGNTVTTLGTTIQSSKASSTNIEIPFFANELTATSLVLNSAFTVPTAEYALQDDKLILKKDNASYTFRVASNSTKTMVLTLSDSSTYTFTVNVTD